MTCFSCGADVQDFHVQCPACDIPLTPEVAELHFKASSADSRMATLRTVAASVVIGAFVAGLAFGVAIRPSASSSAAARPASEEPMPFAILNDVFMRMMNEKVHLNFRSWHLHPQGTVIFEMEAPSAERPSLWEEFSADEKHAVMSFIGAAYTQVHFMYGHPVNVKTDGHPQVAISYYGTEAPVGLRREDGTVHVFPSPFRRR
jgi:hypothetical protein